MKLSKKRKQMFVLTMGLLIMSAIGILIYMDYQEKLKADQETITIGYLSDNLVIERWQRDQEIFRANATKQGAEVLVYNANENNATQIQQIQLLIEKEVDVIVVVPYDRDGLSEIIKEARQTGIKVIAYDRLIRNVEIDAYISFDNVKVGELMADELLEHVPKGNYVIINGSPDDNNSYMFNEGYMNVLSSEIEKGNIDIIEEIYADDWREEPAYDLIARLLDEGQQIDAIIGANDRLAEAAIRALAEEGLAGKVFVAGHDADISACQRIVEGTQHMTVYKPIRTLAEAAVNLAIQFAKNEEPLVQQTIYNGQADIPYIRLDVLSVTQETLDETVIEDGFHRREDVYRE
jgi:D-xylose transport system substrate-binding protein